ncbi:hypothetical protein ABZP36_007631 [Zizania latifolia]
MVSIVVSMVLPWSTWLMVPMLMSGLVKIIEANYINEAAEKIIDLLESTSKGNVIYFNGWDGVGASAILKVVARLLKSSSGATAKKLGLHKFIHVDCSLWQSKRSLQKAIAEELDLPLSLMAKFNQWDEEDDFNGTELGAREVIPDVHHAIFKDLANHAFLVIFHNGSGSYIDLMDCGVPIIGQLPGKRVLWTLSQGRFRVFTEEKEDLKELVGPSYMSLSCYPYDHKDFDVHSFHGSLLHVEAEEVANYTGVPEPSMSPMIVLKCALYVALALRGDDYGIDWATHATNYWVCDGIIEEVDGHTSAWEIGDALHRSMHLGWNRHYSDGIVSTCQYLLQKRRQGDDDGTTAIQVPPQDTSFFLTANGPNNATRELEAIMFTHSSHKLRVIHLSQCSFSFASPPFICCSSLRFLLLHSCKDKDAGLGVDGGGGKEHQSCSSLNGGECFRKLWVLDLSHTDWYWLLSAEALDLMANLRELNVKGVKHWGISHLTSVRSSTKQPGPLTIVKLRVTTNPLDNIGQEESPASFPDLSSWSILKTVILDGCVELERLGPHVLPPSLESFSFSTNNNVEAKIRSISFQGCTLLKSVFLRGLFNSLLELDVSGTSVKTLDLRETSWGGLFLSRLSLLGCEKLHAILWPPQMQVKVLHIDTTTAELGHVAGLVAGSPSSSTADFKHWYISLRDIRLLRSLNNVDSYHNTGSPHLEVSSPASAAATGCYQGIIGDEQQVMTISQLPQPTVKIYADVAASAVLKDHHLQGQATLSQAMICHISLQDEMQSSSNSSLPDSICRRAVTLNVHDSSSITSITAHSAWHYLKQCQVERCPNIQGVVFPTSPNLDGDDIFEDLKRLWVSQLRRARYIWDWNTSSSSSFRLGPSSFESLEFLHLDHCPRLIHVLPLYTSKNHLGCPELKTLEIVCCGDLKEVFPWDGERKEFPELSHIHLHELPALHSICGHTMFAPKLETVTIRGCWSLKRLPAVGAPPHITKLDCDKQWWDGLHWDGHADHQPSLYDPTYSRHCNNNTLRRLSLLR